VTAEEASGKPDCVPTKPDAADSLLSRVQSLLALTLGARLSMALYGCEPILSVYGAPVGMHLVLSPLYAPELCDVSFGHSSIAISLWWSLCLPLVAEIAR
jgi:hypothetical protein